MKHFLYEYKVHLLITLGLIFLAAGIPFEAYYVRQFQASELELRSEAEGMAQLIGEEEPAFIIPSGNGYSGIVAETESVTLQKGSYLLQVLSLSEGKENYVEVYSTRKLMEDNTEGELLARESINSEGDLTSITFQTTDSMEDISVRIGYGGEGSLNVSGFYLASQERMYTDKFCLMGAILLISALLLLWKLRGGHLDVESRTAALLLTGAVILVSLPLSYDFVIDGNDLYYQFHRILGIQEGLKSGQLPVKIHSTMLHGYGYGSSIFYPELFLYFPALLGCMGVSLINCYKVMIICMNGATAFVSYKAFKGLLRSREMGLLGAVLYTLSIYRLIDLYTRAAIGEAMAMIFLPLVVWGMYELFLGKPDKWYVAVLGFTGILQSHILTVELAICFGGIFGLCCLGKLREKGRLKALLTAAGATLLLNLGLFLPLLHHAGYPYRVFALDNTLSWWTVTLPKLFDLVLANPAERCYAGVQNSGEMPCSLGFVLLAGLLTFLYVYYREEKRDALLKGAMGALGLSVLGIYLSTDFFPWDTVQGLPVLHRLVTSIQLPWRFLALSSVLLCLVCAVGFYRLSSQPEIRRVICGGACVLAFLCAGIYISRYCEEGIPKYTKLNQYQREQAQVDVMYFINVDHSNSYRIWNRTNTFVPSKDVTVNGCKRSEALTAEFQYFDAAPEAPGEERWVDIPLTYYPNYRAYTEDKTELATGVGDQGVLRVYLPEKEEGLVKIKYQEPWYYLLGRLISIISLFALLGWIWREKNRKREV